MGNGRVLVVDDEAQIRTTVKMVLTQAGYDVVEAEDGEKAIQAIKADDNPLMVDMLLCDMQMPKLGGLGVIDYFRTQFPSVPIVVMTGYADVRDAAQLMKQGIVDYLVKPVEKSKLVNVVNEAVNKHTYRTT
ncbi:MAG TPA: response regulator [Nitrospira sp.]|nr:response regulator [Nitrospira sp.]